MSNPTHRLDHQLPSSEPVVNDLGGALDPPLAELPALDWLRMWALLPARHLPQRIAHEVRQSVLDVSAQTYIGVASLGLPCFVMAAVSLVPIDETAGRVWTVAHVVDYMLIAITGWIVTNFRRNGTLDTRRISVWFAPTVVLSGVLWGTLPAVVGPEPIGSFYLACSISAMLIFFGFFWTAGNWPMSVLYAVTGISMEIMWLWYFRIASAPVITGLLVIELVMVLALSLLATVAMVSARYETVLARERKQMVHLLLRDYERGGHDWVWAADDELRFTHVPPRMKLAADGDDRFGVGRSLLDLLVGDEEALSAVAAEQPFQAFVSRDVGGRQIEIRLWGRPNIVGKRCLGYLGVGSDEGARLRSAQAELTRERLDAMVTMTGGLAHDFNNLLATILGSIEVSSIGLDLGADVRPHLRQATDACLRTRRITADLVAAAGQDHTSEPAPFDLVEVVRSVLDDVRPLFPSVELVLVADEGAVFAIADRTHCMRTVRNLVDNACNAISSHPDGDKRGRVEARVGMTRDADGMLMAVLSISDDGPGIPNDIRLRLFEPFFTTRKAAGGTGLGLAVASGFARQSGGTLTLAPSDEGATFELTLPHASLADVASCGVDEATAPVVNDPCELAGTILVVEDDRHLAVVLGQWMQNFGAEAVVVGSVHEGVEYLDRPDIELACVITDLVLPDGEGFDVVAALNERRPHTPAVYISGFTRSLPTHVDVALRRPLVAKPFSSTELLRAINQAGLRFDPPRRLPHRQVSMTQRSA